MQHQTLVAAAEGNAAVDRYVQDGEGEKNPVSRGQRRDGGRQKRQNEQSGLPSGAKLRAEIGNAATEGPYQNPDCRSHQHGTQSEVVNVAKAIKMDTSSNEPKREKAGRQPAALGKEDAGGIGGEEICQSGKRRNHEEPGGFVSIIGGA